MHSLLERGAYITRLTYVAANFERFMEAFAAVSKESGTSDPADYVFISVCCSPRYAFGHPLCGNAFLNYFR